MGKIQRLVVFAALVFGVAGWMSARGAREDAAELREELANEHALGIATEVKLTALRNELVRLQATSAR